LVLAFAGSWSAPVRAATQHAERKAVAVIPIPPPVVDPERRSYALPLGVSYVLAPFLALGVGGGLSKLTNDDTLSVVGGGLMFLLPAAVHMAHGNLGHGAAVFPEQLLITAFSLFAGGGIGYAIGAAGCPGNGEECDFAGWNGLLAGALVGGLAGYTAFAIYDVHNDAWAPAKNASPLASLRLWLNPLPRSSSARTEPASPWHGLQLGVTLAL
jgi:hypothetical protein